MTRKQVAYGDEMISLMRSSFQKIPEHRGPQTSIRLEDALMSAYALFSLKFPSLLEFEEERKQRHAAGSNLETIYEVKHVPSDTQMRSVVDEVAPEYLRGVFSNIFQWIQNKKLLKPYAFMKHQGEDHFLISVDGTGFFSSHEIRCPHCLTKKSSKTGKITYDHQMLTAAIVHPDLKTVIPLAPEAIIRQDGVEKNDCEMNALKRWVQYFRQHHPQLKVILNLDGLYGNNKIVRLLRNAQMPFMIVVGETDHAGIFRYVNGAQQRGNVIQYEWEEYFGEKIRKTKKCRVRIKTDVPLNGQEDTEWVNFIEYWEETLWIDSRGKEQKESYHCAWVTDLSLYHGQKQAQTFVKGARSRWKIENETHNTLKNQGYHLEHNYGHGECHLAENFILLILLAFLVDQIQQMGCRYFQKLLGIFKRKIRVWNEIRNIYQFFRLTSWTHLLETASQNITGKGLLYNTS